MERRAVESVDPILRRSMLPSPSMQSGCHVGKAVQKGRSRTNLFPEEATSSPNGHVIQASWRVIRPSLRLIRASAVRDAPAYDLRGLGTPYFARRFSSVLLDIPSASAA